MKTFKTYINEGKMSQIHADIEDHLGKHLQNYKKTGGSEHFGSQTVKTAKHISKLHGIEQKHAQKFVNDYVDSNLKEDAGMGAGAVSTGPTVKTGPQSATDPVSATAVKPKKQPKTLFSVRRKRPVNEYN